MKTVTVFFFNEVGRLLGVLNGHDRVDAVGIRLQYEGERVIGK